MLKKIIFLLAWIGIFLISVVNINYILFPNQFVFKNPIVDLTQISLFEFKMGVLVVSIIYLLLFVYKFLSLFEREKDYVRKTQNGTLKISKNTINNYVIDLLKKDNDITGIKVHSGLKGKNFLIRIKFELLSKININNKISEVQDFIKKDLMNNIGVDVNKVEVSISKLGTKEKEVLKGDNEDQHDNVEVSN